VITPGEAATIAAVVDTFVRAIETSDFERRLRLVEADHFNNPGETAGNNGATRMGTATTQRRDLAADQLKMAGYEINDSIDDCSQPTGQEAARDFRHCEEPQATKQSR
jgi:hypothetical protein